MKGQIIELKHTQEDQMKLKEDEAEALKQKIKQLKALEAS